MILPNPEQRKKKFSIKYKRPATDLIMPSQHQTLAEKPNKEKAN
jgi:hypothetical protein